MLSNLYASVAAYRRRWFEQHPESRRRLTRPVISVGALDVGGRGKTPVAGLIAELLRDAGEYPAILSRGYGREDRTDGVVVVRDRDAVRVTVTTAGDEPLMLAERLQGVCVLVSDDRYMAGRLAETRLGATVHVLDDGFQHLALARDIDLLLTHADDLDQKTLPSGRLRERPDTAQRADAVIVDAADRAAAVAVADRLGVETVFRLERTMGTPQLVGLATSSAAVPDGARVLAVAGIAMPVRFGEALTATGYDVVDVLAFKDHHRFTSVDITCIADRARCANVEWVLVTEKDAVRLAPHVPLPFRLASVPLAVRIEPAGEFSSWLLTRLPRDGAFR